jgi:nitroreductase
MKLRRSQYHISEYILNRWSPRALSSELMTDKEMMTLFEAARWAPSSYNAQLWRFIYGKRGTAAFDKLFNLLVPFNQSWTKNASFLILVISRNNFTYNGKPSPTHSFDTGAAMENLALQGFMDGFVVHGMEGFDYDKAKVACNVPDGYTIEAMFAVGKKGSKEALPQELQEREIPSDRVSLESIIFEGNFKE